MNTTYQLWTHPTSGQKRVYVNCPEFKINNTKMYFLLTKEGLLDLNTFSNYHDKIHFEYLRGLNSAWSWAEAKIGTDNLKKIEQLLK